MTHTKTTDYREELLNKIMITLHESGIEDLDKIKAILIGCIGSYEISERCTDIVVADNSNAKLIELFFVTKQMEGCSDETTKNRFSVYKRFCEDVNKSLNDVNVFDIRLWLAKMQRTVSLSTTESYRTSLNSLFVWLHSEGFIENNPMINVKPIKHPDPIKKSFTPVEVDSLKSACKNKLERAMIELLLSSGLRCEELCELKWENINFITKDITVVEGKGNKNRITMMDDVAKKYLLEYRSSLTYESDYVFAVRYGGKIKVRTTDSVWCRLKDIAKRAGVDEVHPHKFRHTFATTLYKRGLDVRMIQKLLGHSNINTTMIYIDSDIEMLRDAYKKCV